MMKTSEQNLIERIQEYVKNAKVIEARGLDIIGDFDDAIYPFAYRTDQCDYEMRGAFTNGDPVWEEGNEEAFAKMMGEA